MCYPGLTSEDCSINIGDYSPSVCQNNGTCEDRVDEFICSCPDTYAGKLVKGGHLVHLNKTTVEIIVSVTHQLLRALLKLPVL